MIVYKTCGLLMLVRVSTLSLVSIGGVCCWSWLQQRNTVQNLPQPIRYQTQNCWKQQTSRVSDLDLNLFCSPEIRSGIVETMPTQNTAGWQKERLFFKDVGKIPVVNFWHIHNRLKFSLKTLLWSFWYSLNLLIITEPFIQRLSIIYCPYCLPICRQILKLSQLLFSSTTSHSIINLWTWSCENDWDIQNGDI